VNRHQRRVAALGLVLLALLGLFPPWAQSVTAPGGFHKELPLAYAFILKPPQPQSDLYSVTLDFRRLAVSWAVVMFVVGGLVVLLHGAREW
jgi:hypothetical protein